MKTIFYRAAKNLLAAVCVLICICCVAVKFRDWAEMRGGEALLFTAGMKTETAEASPAPTASAPPVQEDEESEEIFDDSGTVTVFEEHIPNVKITPDPNRKTGEVQEIVLEGGAQVDNFFVKDSTNSGTDLNEELKAPTNLDIKADGSVEVLIYHTHTSEAYTESFSGFYYLDMQTRTENKDMSVVAVGEEIKKQLEAAGIGVVHDTTVNDATYNGSYSRSWETIQKNLKEYPSIKITIDVHRDSMTTDSGLKYKPTAEINGRKAAQLMLLAGCDYHGDWGDFPNWLENLRLILKVQQKAQEMYPELMRPLNFSNSKYNMNATTGSMLVEVGTEVNTVSEAKYSGRLLGEILAEILPELD